MRDEMGSRGDFVEPERRLQRKRSILTMKDDKPCLLYDYDIDESIIRKSNRKFT